MVSVKLGKKTYAYYNAYIWIVVGFVVPSLFCYKILKVSGGKSILYGIAGAAIATIAGFKLYSQESTPTKIA